MIKQQKPWRNTVACFACLVSVFLAGCGPKTYPVQEDIGKTAMQTFLDSWKAGEPIDGLANKSPKIVGVDQEWKSGVKLLQYEIVESRSYERSMTFAVKLTTQRVATIRAVDPVPGVQGDEEAGIVQQNVAQSTQVVDEVKHANYTVSTQPFITIFRDEAD